MTHYDYQGAFVIAIGKTMVKFQIGYSSIFSFIIGNTSNEIHLYFIKQMKKQEISDEYLTVENLKGLFCTFYYNG